MEEKVQIRITGLLNDVENWVRIMQKIPGVKIIQQSKSYQNRGSPKVRIYVTIAFADEQ